MAQSKQELNSISAHELKPFTKIEAVIEQTHELVGRGRWLRLKDHDSCVIDTQSQRFYWNSRNLYGDVYEWLMALHNWDFAQAKAYAARLAGVDLDTGILSLLPPTRRTHDVRTRQFTPPPPKWRSAAREVVAKTEMFLWSPTGQAALVWLKQRGLIEATIKQARLGWNPEDRWDHPYVWGLDGGKQIFTPEGLIIPWEYQGQLCRIRVRRPDEARSNSYKSRYTGPRVYPHTKHHCRDHNLLYNADTIKSGRPAILVEGELDALSLIQVATDLVAVVATGSVSGGRSEFWQARLAEASIVLVAFDADDAGDTNAQFWTEKLSNAVRWRPLAHDPNQMLQDGLDLRAWVQAGLRAKAI